MAGHTLEGSSFRDPSGFLFYQDGAIYRQINKVYSAHYDHLMSSGLYKKLTDDNLLIPHSEADIDPPDKYKAYKIIQPEHIPFISYPHEWSFTQLKQAALTTLKIQQIAMKFEMTLKDATAYNIQFIHARPVFIDTISFEKYEEGMPWKAYRQFCQHFFAPLALMSHRDVRLGQLFRIYMDGIPLDLASKLLPLKTRSMLGMLGHIHAHAKSQKHYEGKKIKTRHLSRCSLEGVIASLHSATSKIKWSPKDTEWGDYYSDTNYSDSSFNHKKAIVSKFVEKTNPKCVLDLGANTGVFSRISAKKGIPTIACDIDPVAVEKNYLTCMKNDEKILPLLLDLANPSPYMGWDNMERQSFLERSSADMVFALALIHHLVISNNLPLAKLSTFFKKMCVHLVIEFVPKSDSQVKILLATREDIFDDYTRQHFEEEFGKNFKILESHMIENSERTIYLMKRLSL